MKIIFIKKINIVSADLCYVLLSDGTCFEAHDEWILGEENDLVYYDGEKYLLYFIKYNDYRGYRIVEKFNNTGEFDPMFLEYPENVFPKYRKRLVTRVVKFPNDVFVALDDEIFHHTNGYLHAYWNFVEKGQHVLIDGTTVVPMPLGIDAPQLQDLLKQMG